MNLIGLNCSIIRTNFLFKCSSHFTYIKCYNKDMTDFVTNNLYLYEADAFCGSVVYYEGEYHVFYIASNQTCIRHYHGESLLSLIKADDIVSKSKKISHLCSYVKSGILYILFSLEGKNKVKIAKSKDWNSFELDEVEINKSQGLNAFKIVQSQDSMYLMTSEKRNGKNISIYVSNNPYIWDFIGQALDDNNIEINSPSIIGVNDYQYLIYESNGTIYAQKGVFNKETCKFNKIEDPCYLNRGYNPKAYVLSNGKIVLISDFNGNIIIQELGALGGLTLNPNFERLKNLHAKSFDDKFVEKGAKLLENYKKESEYEFDIELLENTNFVLKIKESIIKHIYVAYDNAYGNVVFSSVALNDDLKQRTKNIGILNSVKVKIIFSNNIGQVYINEGVASFTFNAEGFIPDCVEFSCSEKTLVKINRYDIMQDLGLDDDENIYSNLF